MRRDCDVLMITYQSAEYVERTLPALLENVADEARVWVWHNGDDAETLAVVDRHRSELFRFHHSRENLKLWTPTTWLWQEAEGPYVSKVDDDCIEEEGWLRRLRDVHEGDSGLGAIGACRIRTEDRDPAALEKKRATTAGGHEIVLSVWVQGSGYLLPLRVINELGGLQPDENFTRFCKRAAIAGYRNGFVWPLIFEDHMDDPRSNGTLLTSQAAFEQRMPLSARRLGISSLGDWQAEMTRNALEVQRTPYDPGRYKGIRRRARNLVRRLRS